MVLLVVVLGVGEWVFLCVDLCDIVGVEFCDECGCCVVCFYW